MTVERRRAGWRRRDAGVTLTELMIVVVVVGILASIALPSYRQHAIRVRRTDAKVQLLAVAQQYERCMTRFNSYVDAGCAVVLPVTTVDGTYRIEGEVQALTYLLRATPLGAQAEDRGCNVLTLDQLGQQGVSGGTQPASECW